MKCDNILGYSSYSATLAHDEDASAFPDAEALACALVPDPEGVVFSVAREKALEYVRKSKSWKQLAKRLEAGRETETNEITNIALNYLISRLETVYVQSRRD
jgi:hypothetical protein